MMADHSASETAPATRAGIGGTGERSHSFFLRSIVEWKIKGKDLLAVHVNAEEIIIETEKKYIFVLKQFHGATVAQADQ